MSKQIKPGMLCIVRGATPTLSLNGMIVIAKKRSIPETIYTSNCGKIATRTINDAVIWDCSGKDLPWLLDNNQMYNFDLRAIAEDYLIPISDPDIELTTEDVKELETI